MNTLIFHKSLVKITNIREVQMELSSVTDLILFIKNLVPSLNSLENSYTFLINGQTPIPKSWIYQNEILDTTCTIWIVPVIYGKAEGAAAFASLVTTTLLKIAISTAINFLLSAIITQLLPKPKRNEEQDSSVRVNNDIFSSIVNTVDAGTTIPLNYGMIRVGGHYLSADVETVTIPKATQAVPKEDTTEPEIPPSDPYNPCPPGYVYQREIDRESSDGCVLIVTETSNRE